MHFIGIYSVLAIVLGTDASILKEFRVWWERGQQIAKLVGDEKSGVNRVSGGNL